MSTTKNDVQVLVIMCPDTGETVFARGLGLSSLNPVPGTVTFPLTIGKNIDPENGFSKKLQEQCHAKGCMDMSEIIDWDKMDTAEQVDLPEGICDAHFLMIDREVLEQIACVLLSLGWVILTSDYVSNVLPYFTQASHPKVSDSERTYTYMEPNELYLLREIQSEAELFNSQ